MATIHDRLVSALLARGYRVTPNPRGSRYTELKLGQGGVPVDPTMGFTWRLLVGRAGALRKTTSSIAASTPFSDVFIKKLLAPVRGDAVIDSRGRLGMVSSVQPELEVAMVQFGADGPFRTYRFEQLLFATLGQVEAAGRCGVGGMCLHGVGEVAKIA